MVRRARDLMGSGELSAEEVARTLKACGGRRSEGSAPPAIWMKFLKASPTEAALRI